MLLNHFCNNLLKKEGNPITYDLCYILTVSHVISLQYHVLYPYSIMCYILTVSRVISLQYHVLYPYSIRRTKERSLIIMCRMYETVLSTFNHSLVGGIVWSDSLCEHVLM